MRFVDFLFIFEQLAESHIGLIVRDIASEVFERCFFLLIVFEVQSSNIQEYNRLFYSYCIVGVSFRVIIN